MQKDTHKKSPWRWACLGLSVISALRLAYRYLPGLQLMLFNKINNAASIGVIGGADGPTSIFVTTTKTYSGLPAEVIYLLILIMGVIGFIALSRLKHE